MGLRAKRNATENTQSVGGNAQVEQQQYQAPAQQQAPAYQEQAPQYQAPPAQQQAPQYQEQAPQYAPPVQYEQQQAPAYQEQAPQYQAPQYQAPPTQQQYQAPPTQAPAYQAPPVGQAPAVQGGGGGNAVANANAGVLDNIDDMNIGGNYVTMDGSNFLYKATDDTADTIEAVITYGKRFYQWYDEENQRYNDSDTKLDDRYKLKFELRWFEDVDGEPQEHIMSLPTASAMTFLQYIKGLSKQGLGVGHVVTRFTISRQHNTNLNIRYSRTEFEMAGIAEQPQQ